MTSRQTQANRRKSVAALRALMTPYMAALTVRYDVKIGFVFALGDEVLCEGRYEVVHAYIAGHATAMTMALTAFREACIRAEVLAATRHAPRL